MSAVSQVHAEHRNGPVRDESQRPIFGFIAHYAMRGRWDFASDRALVADRQGQAPGTTMPLTSAM
jgi:hypothetical protein